MKRLLSIILSSFLLLALYPSYSLAASSGDIWDGKTVTAPTKLVQKDGIYYYEITKCAELAYVAQTGGDWLSKNYLLSNDLCLNSVSPAWDQEGNCTNSSQLNVWTPIGNKGTAFSGIFDGGDHTISGIFIVKEEPVTQPVSPDPDGSILLPSGGSGGGRGGNVDGKGLFGASSNTIKNLHVTSSYISGDSYLGGIAGGGSKVFDCSFNGIVKGSGSNIGGIIGGFYGKGVRTPPSPTLDDNPYLKYDICFCENNGSIWGNEYIGGISGSHGSLYGCINAGQVTGVTNVAGLHGSGSQVVNCINSGTISGITNVAGISINSNRITDCSNRGSVSGESYVGGIAANASTINTSSNSGPISGKEHTGGIAGQASNINNAYNTGSVKGSIYTGGIVGAGNSIANCYSTGAVTPIAGTLFGAIVGSDDPIWGKISVSNCYYLKNGNLYGCGNVANSGLSDPSGMSGRSSAELKNQSTYNGWDFTNTWTISDSANSGYPILAWEASNEQASSLSGIDLNQASLSLSVGDTAYLSVSPLPAAAALPALSWSSSNNAVATISPDGMITAVSSGSATITVTGGGFSANCNINVKSREANEYSIGELIVRDHTGKQLDTVPSSSFLVTIPITKLSDGGNSMVILGTYSNGGQFNGLMYAQIEDVSPGGTVKITLPVDNKDGTITDIKAFIVSSFTNMTPIGDTSSFPN